MKRTFALPKGTGYSNSIMNTEVSEVMREIESSGDSITDEIMENFEGQSDDGNSIGCVLQQVLDLSEEIMRENDSFLYRNEPDYANDGGSENCPSAENHERQPSDSFRDAQVSSNTSITRVLPPITRVLQRQEEPSEAKNKSKKGGGS